MANEIPQDMLEQLVKMLSDLVSNDNTVRSTAEQQLNSDWMVSKPDALLTGLAHLACHHEDAVVCKQGYQIARRTTTYFEARFRRQKKKI